MKKQAAGEDIAWEDLHPETQRLLSRRQMLGTSGKLAASFAIFGGMLTVVGCSSDSTTAASTTTGAPTTTGKPTVGSPSRAAPPAASGWRGPTARGWTRTHPASSHRLICATRSLCRPGSNPS